MSIYEVQKDYELPPHLDWEDSRFQDGGWLVVGDRLEDGQLEPDAVAELLHRGVLAHVNPPVKSHAGGGVAVRQVDPASVSVAVEDAVDDDE